MLNTATTLMAKLLRPIILFLHDLSINISYYVDDGLTLQSSFSKCRASHNFILFVLRTAGWEVALDKCSERPSNTILYLGFHICSISMRIFAPQSKLVRLINAIDKANNDNKSMGSIPVKQLAQNLGVICHLLTSHGNILRIATRINQHHLGKAVQLNGWSGQVTITEDMRREMELCQKYLIK